MTITDVPDASSAAFTATITFTEGVNGFTVEDIAVGNGAASAFTGADGDTEYTALIAPTADGAVTVDVAEDVAMDAAGNGNAAAARASSIYDNTAPTVTITGVSATSMAAFMATFTFSEGMDGFAVEDIAVGNGTASAFTGLDGNGIHLADLLIHLRSRFWASDFRSWLAAIRARQSSESGCVATSRPACGSAVRRTGWVAASVDTRRPEPRCASRFRSERPPA